MEISYPHKAIQIAEKHKEANEKATECFNTAVLMNSLGFSASAKMLALKCVYYAVGGSHPDFRLARRM
ncbi:hypothetical protein [Ralstonia phage RSP15]|uniref:hypothetical protein n=1 Tax=Ralstonia phage RSP15 TaxID=1785960 RepID=UPI00074D2FC4|nr:hypothetical protein BH754_gp150 [Ralstonia phage RSP15]BAU40156.1 hypothetical protein [Ralstonia phage RSP15]